MSNSLAIVVPTHNSKHGLDIILRGLIERFDPSTIHVIDSSEQRNEVWADRGIQYRHFPSYSISQKLTTALREIPSEYVVLHPDEDFLNYDAIARVSEGMQGTGFSSVLALNLLLRLGREAPQVSLWRLAWFDAMAQHVLPGGTPWHHVNSPCYPLIWGIHRTKYLSEFFELSQSVDWFADNGAHVMLYDRLFNVFMAAKSPVFVCDVPTFIRMAPYGKWKKILPLDQWLEQYNSKNGDQRRFVKDLASVYAPALGLPQHEFEQLFVESLSREASVTRRIRTRLDTRKKFFEAIRLRPQITRVSIAGDDGYINVKRSRHETSNRRFKVLLANQIKPFLDVQGAGLVTLWRGAAAQAATASPTE